MATPDDRRYSDEHEWALFDGSIVTVGVTQFATDSLGDVVYVDLPEVGAKVAQQLGAGRARKDARQIKDPNTSKRQRR